MARFNGGWVKLYRSVMEGDIKDNPYLLALWSWLLAAATWKESKLLDGGKQRVLPPGSVVFGMSELAATWDCSTSTIWRWAHYLHDTHRIVLETGTRGCIVTILNWDVYQGQEDETRTPSESEAKADRTPSEGEEKLSEEVKKEERRNIPSLSRKDIDLALEEWRSTLASRGILKDPRHDAPAITSLIQRYGIERTLDALRGPRFEGSSEKFNAKQHCRISRIAGPKFDYFENLGAQNRPQANGNGFYNPPEVAS